MGLLHTFPYWRIIDIQPQRQGINKQPQPAIHPFSRRHTPEQHGAEHHVCLSAGVRQHLRPGQMAQRRQTDATLPGLTAQTAIQLSRQHPVEFRHLRAVTVHFRQAKRQGRLCYVRQHVREETGVCCLTDTQPGLRHQIAERYRSRQCRRLSRQIGPDFTIQDFQRGMITNQVMQYLQNDPTPRRVPGNDKLQ
ncbi:hypothetical protein Xvie_04095 [Xenorhabdus vietnamensis]|uniref:Uncharacterized protein n=1 Tax=Xenorhabdus vietnamensis TaxID=351656 RepID=A0A1Y2S903_9GAMM|nr:hypothetical protein Xvie_04095 [Xenorhabdus vietnamensis]